MMGESALRMFSGENEVRSSYDLLGRRAASHHSESGGASRYNNFSVLIDHHQANTTHPNVLLKCLKFSV